MKCNRCGEPCKDKQVFCLKCGSPIQVVPDFNLIEAELASSVGELLGDFVEKSEENDEPKNDINGKTINLNSIKTNADKQIEEDMSEKYKDKSKAPISENYQDEEYDTSEEDNTGEEDEVSSEEHEYINRLRELKKQKEEKRKKKIIVAAVICAAIVVIVIVAMAVKMLSGTGKYEEYYSKAVEYYEDKDYDNAEDQLLFAISSAKNDNQTIEAKEMLYLVYLDMSDINTEKMLDLINDLIELDPDNDEYKDWLTLYSSDKPAASVKSGSYDEYFSLELSADNSEIYFTTDNSTPTKNSTLYSAPIEINKEGTTVIKAISVSNGTISDVVEFEYEIKLSQLEAPVITPDGGNYTTNSTITVTAGEGSKIYYTYDGSEPDETSTEYTGPVEMLRGNNVFSAIAINSDGVKSSVVFNVYNLTIAATYTYNEAESLLLDKLVANKTLVSKNGDAGSGAKMTFEYKETVTVKDDEYYIITSMYYDANNTYRATYVYGVGTISGKVVELNSGANGYTIKSEL